MPMFEFKCQKCSHQFEQITSTRDPDMGLCPACGARESEKLLSNFAVSVAGYSSASPVPASCHACPGQGHCGS